jgi:hypothetical protein
MTLLLKSKKQKKRPRSCDRGLGEELNLHNYKLHPSASATVASGEHPRRRQSGEFTVTMLISFKKFTLPNDAFTRKIPTNHPVFKDFSSSSKENSHLPGPYPGLLTIYPPTLAG